MAAAIASTTPTRSNLIWGSNGLVVSFFFFSSVLLMQMPEGNAALAPEEESVLEVLRQRFNQPNWTGDPCNSDWITCSNSSEVAHVERINLTNRNLTGTIPADVAKLRQVEDLILSVNKLEGSIPDLRNMTNLINLDLGNNRLSGRIPDTSAFTNISQILLGNNNLSGGIPTSLFQHPSVTKIYLNNNPLGGPIPDMSELIKLTDLDLTNTDINGSIPESITTLSQARIINFHNNANLKGTIPKLSGMIGLQYLDIGLCGLTGTLPGLENSGGLAGIYLENNDLSGPIPRALFEHQSLQWLQLHNNPKLSGTIPDMSLISGVEIFGGYNCNFSGPLPSMETNIKLRDLLLANNQLTFIPPDLKNLTKLQTIDVSNNKMVGNLPELPAGSTQTSTEGYRLNDLDFTNNEFSGEIPHSWTELTFLERMSLGYNNLSGYIPVRLGNLTNLQELNLTTNNFSGPIPNEIGLLEQLTSLDLRNNRFEGKVPETLLNLPKLTTLRLENNRFTGIPQALTNKEGLNITYDKNISIITANSTASSDTVLFSTGAIVGIVIGVLAASIAILGIVGIVIRRRNSKHADQLSREDMPKSSPAFTLKQIKAITANNQTLIGKGGFGKVYHGKLPDGKEVAVKVREVDSKQGAQEFLNEVRLLSRLHHGNLVPLVGYCLESQQQILVYQYMAQGTLYNHLYHTGSDGSVTKSAGPSSYQPLDWKTRLDIAINAARGLEYLHKDCNPPVIHRDVKSSNILLTEKFQAKVGDLGISKQAPDSEEAQNVSGVSTAIKGTFGYMDPEYFVRRKLTTKSDVYSFGVVLLEVITGMRPQSQNFPNSDETNLIDWVQDAARNNEVETVVDHALRGQYNTDGLLKVAKVALSCVSPSGAERPVMGEIVHILTEAVQMEGHYVETSTPATEINVPFSGLLGGSRSATSPGHSTQSYEAFSHPSWNTDPR